MIWCYICDENGVLCISMSGGFLLSVFYVIWWFLKLKWFGSLSIGFFVLICFGC